MPILIAVLTVSDAGAAGKRPDGSGDAIIAFHGPFGAEDLIRSGGGKISNGCLRMLTEDQLKMDGIPLGTPVDIVA